MVVVVADTVVVVADTVVAVAGTAVVAAVAAVAHTETPAAEAAHRDDLEVERKVEMELVARIPDAVAAVVPDIAVDLDTVVAAEDSPAGAADTAARTVTPA